MGEESEEEAQFGVVVVMLKVKVPVKGGHG